MIERGKFRFYETHEIGGEEDFTIRRSKNDELFVQAKISFLPPPDFQAESLKDFMVLGHIMTAMPAVNAIPAVVAAPPGIVTYADLRLPLPRGLVRL